MLFLTLVTAVKSYAIFLVLKAFANARPTKEANANTYLFFRYFVFDSFALILLHPFFHQQRISLLLERIYHQPHYININTTTNTLCIVNSSPKLSEGWDLSHPGATAFTMHLGYIWVEMILASILFHWPERPKGRELAQPFSLAVTPRPFPVLFIFA